MDDHALASSVLGGDRDGFRVLVEREQVAVFNLCLRILGRPHDAEDVAQESFLMAYRSLGGWRGEAPLAAWLRRIAARQALRRLGQRRDVLELPGEIPLRAPGSDPLTLALAQERQHAVRLAVQRLAEPYREVVALRYFGELSLGEIAAATGRPLNTVKTQVRRGLERLRPTLTMEAVA